ncbi:MAG: DUF4404 family protein [Pseudomonadaceae bacterium]
MPTERLKSQLESLQTTLNESDSPLSNEEREALQALATSLEARLLNETGAAEVEEDPSLVDGVNLMAEQFEARHPTLASTLRSVMQSLADMGI